MEVYPLVKMDKDFDAIFSNLYSKYYSFLFSYIFSIIHDPDITEDLVHDIFLRLYRLRNLETDSLKIRNYLKKAARNIAIDYLRK
jgi:RNA polymerase sigma-70 factor (ECF subfamily)